MYRFIFQPCVDVPEFIFVPSYRIDMRSFFFNFPKAEYLSAEEIGQELGGN